MKLRVDLVQVPLVGLERGAGDSVGGNSFLMGPPSGCRKCEGAAAASHYGWRCARVADVRQSIRLVAKLAKDVRHVHVIKTHEKKGILISC